MGGLWLFDIGSTFCSFFACERVLGISNNTSRQLDFIYY